MEDKYIILFDGVCNFCNNTINFVIDHDSKKCFQFASLQANFGRLFLLENKINTHDFDSIILIKNQKIFKKSEAIFEITKELTGFWKYIAIFRFLPKVFTDFCYDIFAKNRYQLFGKTDSCRLPTPELRDRFL